MKNQRHIISVIVKSLASPISGNKRSFQAIPEFDFLKSMSRFHLRSLKIAPTNTACILLFHIAILSRTQKQAEINKALIANSTFSNCVSTIKFMLKNEAYGWKWFFSCCFCHTCNGDLIIVCLVACWHSITSGQTNN